ncbi:AzlD domain-containing protein [Lachnospiraceae bacterium MD1]|jgi:branched-subunit amino acid transport protein|uniref:AzlD domain-containing protein n=1 Tax=Variimorphobacter saccharofermentans TaxID=2755051 RepID=A0A839JZS6_9FIRM|nr:AzlD domain-containing protein [Variimorphobacter saccharofermentans]MBB2181981.1 AzlD domain-containing protein [Variimorphobacter saccharofermentans]
MKLQTAFLAILLMALVTYIPRVLPLAIFRKEIKSKYIKSFLHYVPYAVLGALTFPDIFYSTGTLFTAICGTLVAVLLAYREKSLVVVASGAILTVYLTGFLLPYLPF